MPTKPWVLTTSTYLMSRNIEYPLSKEQEANMALLLSRVNDLIKDLPDVIKPRGITSGYRPGRFNEAAGGAPKSGHLVCKAVDLVDPVNAIDDYLDKHPELLVKHKLWREDPARTKGWCHLDTTARPKHTFLV